MGFDVGPFGGAFCCCVVEGFTLFSTDPVLVLARVAKMDRVIEVSMKMTADQVVALLNTVAAPRGPKAVWLPMPPNAAAMSALLPLCSSTTMIRNKQTITWMMVTTTVISSPIRCTALCFSRFMPKCRETFIWCGRGDLNPHSF